jgi:hypothetical protein
VSENLLLHRRPTPHQRAAPSPVARPRPRAEAHTGFAARNSPIDLLFRGLWQLVGGYVFLVLLVKDRKLPR